MSKKEIFCLFFVILVALANVSHAATYYVWDDESSDHQWNTAVNWNSDTVPTSGVRSCLRAQNTNCVIPSGCTAVSEYLWFGPNNGGTNALTICSGSTVNITRSIYVGDKDNATGTLTIDGGTITCAPTYDPPSVYGFTMGLNPDATMTTVMNGGSLNAGALFRIGKDNDSNSVFYLNGGNVYAEAITVNTDADQAKISFAGGMMVIEGDVYSQVNSYVASNNIVAYDNVKHHLAVSVVDGNTIIEAGDPNKAMWVGPTNGGTDKEKMLNLYWYGGINAQDVNAHRVYFGTTFNDVNDANMSSSEFVDLQNNEYPKQNMYSTDLLDYNSTYYWRIDEVNDSVVWKGDVWSFTVKATPSTNESWWWDDDDGTHLYNEPNNWELNTLPLSTYRNRFYISGANCVISSGDYVQADWFYFNPAIEPNGPGHLLIESGATMKVRSFIDIGSSEASGGTVTMDGGIVVCATEYSAPSTYGLRLCKDANSVGHFIMNDGFLDAGACLTVGVANDVNALVELNGGTIWTDSITMNTQANLSKINITGGTLITDGNDLSSINGYIDSNNIVAYDQSDANYVTRVKYHTSRDETVVQARDRAIAWGPDPADEEFGITTDPNLTWSTGDYTQATLGHRVYFGTSFDDVNEATTDSSEYKGVQTGTTYDPGTLTAGETYYWRIDEVNSPTVWKGEVWSFTARIAAFLGAEGAGKWSVGGRGGTVYEVTNTNDSGSGSLREAIDALGPRIVVFRVGGTIALQSELTLNNPYITIAGQTAPGGGICIKNHRLKNYASDVIIRHMRFRPGDDGGFDGDLVDALTIMDGSNVIIDHVSASWSVDETLSVDDEADSVTVQWSAITESLLDSIHPEGTHGDGTLIRGCYGNEVSFHHNFYAHHEHRSPCIGNYFEVGEDSEGLLFDWRNNVIYNWNRFYAGYNGDANSISKANLVNNYYIQGSNSDGNSVWREHCVNANSYVSGNYMDEAEPNDPWDLIYFEPGAFTTQQLIDAYKLGTPVSMADSVTTDDATTVYKKVIGIVGATLPVRDSVDIRVINDFKDGTGSIIDDEDDVGGWPTLATGTAPTDTDHDGMPDYWENLAGLDPCDANDNVLDSDQDGYTNIEEYINGLCEVDPNLVIWLKFDEASGTLACDSSGNGHNGDLYDGPTWKYSSGQMYGAISTDEVNDYIKVPDFDYTTNDEFSVSFWFNNDDVTGNAYQYLISHGEIHTNNSLNVCLCETGTGKTGRVMTVAKLSDGTLLESTPAANYADGDWHMYVITVSQTVGAHIYIDTVEVKSDSNFKGASFNPTTDIYISAREDLDGNRFYGNSDPNEGLLDDYRFYSTALSATDVNDIYEEATR